MTGANGLEDLREKTAESLKQLRQYGQAEDLDRAKPLVEALRNVREFELMGRLAEAISRQDPRDVKNRRLYAQCLIETGKATAAVDLLRPLARRLPKDHPEFAEATGLLGRAHKQIFFDGWDKTSKSSREALKEAIAAYRLPFEHDPAANTWHGVNLVALLSRARRLGMKVAPELTPRDVARTVLAALEQVPAGKRDAWYLPTLAETSLGLSDWDAVERHIHAYAAGDDAKAFLVASTLRQFTEVWDLENGDERGRGVVNILRARLAELPGGTVDLDPGTLQTLRGSADPETGQLEAMLGRDGTATYRWWKAGTLAASSVAAVYLRNDRRFGTGFLIRAGELGLEPAEALVVMTNFHVVNEFGARDALRPEEAEITFEAADAGLPYAIDKILWSSPVERHDVAVLRLAEPVQGIAPLPFAKSLPVLDDKARVYVIGHPAGEALSFSFQGNKLLDHEGPADGKPQIPGVCRVHYRADTERGSSGSPVFNGKLWEVIGLHHMGHTTNMKRLNGLEGTYGANEAISIGSIREAVAKEKAGAGLVD